MNLEKLTRKELIDHIKQETVTISKYNNLETKLKLQKGDNSALLIDKKSLEGQVKSITLSLKRAEGIQKNMAKNLEVEANKMIHEALSKARAIEGDLKYANHTITNTYGLLQTVRKHMREEMRYSNEILDIHLASVFKEEEENKEGGKE